MMWILHFIRVEPLDPPAYQLLYSVVLALVAGTSFVLALRKLRNKNPAAVG